MDDLRKLYDLLKELGPYWLVVVSLQLANVVMQVGCFKQMTKLSEQFNRQLCQLVEQMRRLDERYVQLQQTMCQVCVLKKSPKARGDTK